ncbi:HAE1 family hydrophobic/amphiphilic exporter-1 [Crossiella equi]|uniref:HAE1 family hydrophobic/amphiphilic exporter-1 n=1 Tax=Crossiella equi TaxID=130796 RepID=A0ABS5A7D8_9PSEU|nr:efflux RND transporter permease subunit [Crossiella equi]MBP2472519.1 HAE1 family hydrophobic/amphiphilic exporter-1 [Crossiella equi]
MTSLARLSLANRALIALIAVVAAAFGAFAIPSLKQELLPSLEFPAAAVVAAYPGSSPELVEDQVSIPIENAVRGISGVEKVTSTSREGSSTVQVQFQYGTVVGDAVNDIQQALNRIAKQLPQDVEPDVVVGSTDALPAVVLAASDDGDLKDLAQKLDRSVVPELQRLTGVREASVTGARKQLVTIVPDQAKLAAAGLAPTSVAEALRANGISLPAGSITDGDRSLSVQVGAQLTSLNDLKNLYLTPSAAGGGAANRAARPAKLGDVATITEGEAAATSLTRTNGKESLGISVTLAPDGNAVDVSHAVRGKLDELAKSVGDNAKLDVVFDQAPFVEKSVEGLTTEGALGLGFAVIVILIFLFSIRSTLVTAVSIPLSLVIALIVLWTGDLSLNMLTLGALTIAVGRVVDDSIVVLENIKRHLGYGEDKHEAVIDGVREVAGAVTSSTLTTVAVFLPIAFTGGMVGELFTPFALTVTVALLASLLVSLTIIPVLAYWFLKPSVLPEDEEEAREVLRAQVEKERRGLMQRMYVPVLRWVTRRRWLTVIAALLVFGGTLALVPQLQTNFLDSSGQNTIALQQKLPIGTSLDATDRAAQKVEDILKDTSEVQTYQVNIGSAGGFAAFGGGGGGANTASFSVTLKDGTDTPAVEAKLRERTKDLADAGEVTVGAGGGGGGGLGNTSLEVNVQAGDATALRTASQQVTEAVQGINGLTDVANDYGDSAPRVQVTLNREAAGRLGLTDQAVGQLLAQAFRGATVGQISIDGKRQDVQLSGGVAPQNINQIKAYPLLTAGGPVPLSTVAEVKQVDAPVQIKRIDGSRSATIKATPVGQNLGELTTQLRSKLDGLSLPGGASYTIGGVSAEQQKAFSDLGLALLVAIAIVFVIMVATFQSLIQPLILLVSIPFAATGAIGLLLITGKALGVPALIGMLMLVGIVVTNAIVLIDLMNQYRRDGLSVQEAVIEGGRHRLRPIVMTAAATIFALVPMALGLTGGGGFISQPLAIVVIGGLVSSTILTLLLVPTLYTVVENAKERRQQRRATDEEFATMQ